MAYCYENGIPHSEFMKWSPEDRAKVLAFRIEQGLRCDMCGTAPWEWDPKEGGSRHAYDPVEHFCPGCHRKAMAAQNENTIAGTTVKLVKFTPAQKARRIIEERAREKKRREARMSEAESA